MAKKRKWIQEAIKRPGALTKKAKAANKSISEYCSGSNLSAQSTKQCNLAKTLSGLRKKKG